MAVFEGFGQGMSMDDIFSMFGDIFGGHGGGFGGFGGFGGGGRSAQRKFRGSDLRVKVKLNLKEISTGVEKKFKLKKYVTCDHCHGSGAEGEGGTETCPTCHGTWKYHPHPTKHFWNGAITKRMSTM